MDVLPGTVNVLDKFHPAVAGWFRRTYAAPTEPQTQAWPAISSGNNALIAAQPCAVRGYLCAAEFWDVGTVEDYWRTSAAFAGRGAPASSSAAHAPQIDPSSRVTNSILWDDVVIEAGAVVDQCIVTDGVRVGPGESHRRTILVAGENGGAAAVPMGFEL